MARPHVKVPKLRLFLLQATRALTLLLPKKRGRWKNEKVSDARLVALSLARLTFGGMYASTWWALMQELFPTLPSYTQAYRRLRRLLPVLEALNFREGRYDLVLVDSQPLPVCRKARGGRCKVRRADWGWSREGLFLGFKLHVWVDTLGEVVQYFIKPANEHDFVVGCELNHRWAEFGGPKLVGDKGYVSDGFITPPKKNAKRHDPRWNATLGRLRKRVETVFSQLVGDGVRVEQVKSLTALRLEVALAVLAHNLDLWLVNP